MSKVREAENPVQFAKWMKTKVTTMGNVTEIVTTGGIDTGGCPCKRIDADHYQDMRTGEVKEYKHIGNRSESIRSIRNTLSRIRSMINANVTKPENCRWVTFTYAENMTDTKRLYSDFRYFWMRFKYWCKKKGYSKPEYITVQEPQGRGAWHIHAFFIWDAKAPFIPNAELRDIWSHGWVTIKAVDNCDNVGAYFSAYLADIPLDEIEGQNLSVKLNEFTPNNIELKKFTDDKGRVKEKRFVKGGRLCMYPPGMNIVRTTKGIKRPEVEYMSLESAEKKVSSAKLTFSRDYEIVDDCGTVINVVSKAYYNSKRK